LNRCKIKFNSDASALKYFRQKCHEVSDLVLNDQFFDQVAASDHDKEAGDHQEDGDEVTEVTKVIEHV